MSFQKRLILIIAIAAALYLATAVWLGWESILEAFQQFQWLYLPLCLLLAFGNYVIRFTKWHYYLTLLEIPLDAGLSFRVFLAGMVMSATPGKFGEVFKSYLVKSINGTALSRSAPIVLAERLTDFIAFVLMALLGVTLLPNGEWVFGVSIGLIIVILVLVSWKQFVEGCITLLSRNPIIGAHTEKLRTAYDSTYTLIAPVPLFYATAISVVSWWLECLAFWLVMQGFGAPIPLMDATFIYAFGTILGALLMTPGGIGPAEVTLGGLLVLLHQVAESVAASATFVIRLCTLWFAVAVGLLVLTLSTRQFSPAVQEMETSTPDTSSAPS